jgi:hypothetical protein
MEAGPAMSPPALEQGGRPRALGDHHVRGAPRAADVRCAGRRSRRGRWRPAPTPRSIAIPARASRRPRSRRSTVRPLLGRYPSTSLLPRARPSFHVQLHLRQCRRLGHWTAAGLAA